MKNKEVKSLEFFGLEAAQLQDATKMVCYAVNTIDQKINVLNVFASPISFYNKGGYNVISKLFETAHKQTLHDNPNFEHLVDYRILFCFSK